VLDAYAALGMDLQALVPESVLSWYGNDDYFDARRR